jgi:hypothetical protein
MNQHPLGAPCSRRHFLAKTSVCAGCVAGGLWLGARPARAAAPAGGKPRICVVFCETANDKPIWPNIGYDFGPRRETIVKALTQGCADLEFTVAKVMEGTAATADAVLKNNSQADGYIVCLQGLGWSNDIVKLSGTGKPTLLVDNLFGGSGLLLTKLPQIMKSGQPVDWVSSSNDADLVAVARQFSLIQKGRSSREVAAALRAARRQHTPVPADWTCPADPVSIPAMDKVLAELKQTRLLVVGGGWGGDAFRKAAEEVTGVKLIPVAFEDMAAAYRQADAKAARPFADRWISQAEKVEVEHGEIEKCAVMYVAMKQLMDKHQARGISINCLGGFYGGHLQAYPCLGFSQLNNDGLVGGCEADQMSALTMAVMGVMTGRPGYISDPVIDTSKDAIIYAYCVATTKPFGVNGASNPYQILTHSEDRKGASMRSLLPKGYLTTTLEINPQTRQVLLHQAKALGNNPSDLACRTKLEAAVKGDLEKLTENWRMGWHRVTFYGDLEPHVKELCSRLKLELVREA